MKLYELINHYGSEMLTAAHLGFTHQAIKNWKVAGAIPFESQCVIQVKTEGKFKAEYANNH